MNAYIHSKAVVIAAALGLKAEPEDVFLKRLEGIYLRGVDDACSIHKLLHEKMEARINQLANENARLTAFFLDSEVFDPLEIAHLRVWFSELTDDQILRLQKINPSTHASVMYKLTRKSEG